MIPRYFTSRSAFLTWIPAILMAIAVLLTGLVIFKEYRFRCVFSEPWGRTIDQVEDKWRTLRVWEVGAMPVFESEYIEHHYRATLMESPKGVRYVFYRTYLDKEDGGNTFGWVTDEAGLRIGQIDDGDISREVAAVYNYPISRSRFDHLYFQHFKPECLTNDMRRTR